jgi:formylglycine-generating enzyme
MSSALRSLGWAAALLLATDARAAARGHSPQLQPDEPHAEAATTDGWAVLRAPGPLEILIRGGSFTMGSDTPAVARARELCELEPRGKECSNRELFPSLFADELEPHQVVLDDYWIDRTEVTCAAYRRCTEVGVCRGPSNTAARAWTARDDYPMSLVSWDDATTYCAWRGARLPTEAEWERAARGWSARAFPWGNVFNPMVLNHGRFAFDPLDDGDGFAELGPVGSFPEGATPEGVLDLAGNVEEWVADWYAPSYPEQDTVNPKGPPTGDVRVIRGGSFQSGRPWLRATARSFDLPTRRRGWRGFRCARDHHPAPSAGVAATIATPDTTAH